MISITLNKIIHKSSFRVIKLLINKVNISENHKYVRLVINDYVILKKIITII